MGQSVVYFIASTRPECVKIGWTTQPPEVRLAMFQTGSPVPLCLLGTMPGGRYEEGKLHRRFRSFRVRKGGEWFRLVPELREFIKANAVRPARPEPPSKAKVSIALPPRAPFDGAERLWMGDGPAHRSCGFRNCELCGEKLGRHNNPIPYKTDDGREYAACYPCLQRGRMTRLSEVLITTRNGDVVRYPQCDTVIACAVPALDTLNP